MNQINGGVKILYYSQFQIYPNFGQKELISSIKICCTNPQFVHRVLMIPPLYLNLLTTNLLSIYSLYCCILARLKTHNLTLLHPNAVCSITAERGAAALQIWLILVNMKMEVICCIYS